MLLAAGSPNRHLRRDLVATLAELADPRSVDLLVTALGDDYSKVRRKAISALIRIGEPAVDALLEALASDQAADTRSTLSSAWVRSANRRSGCAHQARHYATLDDGDEVCGGRWSAR